MQEKTVIEVLNDIGYSNLKDCGNYYRTKPNYRTSTNDSSLSINKETGYWYDFGANIGGSLNELVIKSGNANYNFTQKKVIFNENRIVARHLSNSDLNLYKYLKRDHKYWIKRKAKKEHLEKLMGGVFQHEGKFKNRYVFPIYNLHGRICGYSGRSLYDNKMIKSYGISKWKHIGNVRTWDYPYFFVKNRIQESKSVILVESIGDMLALFSAEIYNVLVCFGINVQDGVLKVLLGNDIHSVILAFNNDERCNGLLAAMKAHVKLQNYFDEETIKICLPKEKNDFGDMSKKEIKNWHFSI